MSGYIINPMWFYWVDVLSGLKIVFISLAIVCGIFVMVYGGCYLIDGVDGFLNEEEEQKVKRVVKIVGLITSILIVISVLIPSKETMIQMQLAKFGTYENAGKAIEAIQDATDYILEHLRGE